MANEEQRKMLAQGVQAWNEWRRSHFGELIDLRDSDLRLVNFRGANFLGAYLSGADFRGAKLREADFHEADLRGADLRGADLRDANLRDADLNGVDLSGADLRDANLNGAFLGLTVFGNEDLREVKGLENVVHRAPSTIGIDTIYKSHGEISEVFLKGAGVPKTFLTNMRVLVDAMRPIDFYSCFISYSSKDQAFAERLYADLQSKGVRCWFAPEDLKIGDELRYRIDESIQKYDKLLLVLSTDSVASHWVRHEVETAMGKEQEGKPNVLFPIRLDEAVMQSKAGWASHVRLTRHIGDFIRWKDHDAYQVAFERLLRDLKA